LRLLAIFDAATDDHKWHSNGLASIMDPFTPMQHAWIWLSILAALMQAVRTAAQKALNARASVLATTYVRIVFGLPVMIAYLAAMSATYEARLPHVSYAFLANAVAGAGMQVGATVALILLFQKRGFASATALTKSDTLFTALFGWLFFSEIFSPPGLVGLGLVVAGVVLVTMAKTPVAVLSSAKSTTGSMLESATALALAVALLFSLSYLFVREASLHLGGHPVWAGAWTVVIVTSIQFVGFALWFAMSGEGVMSVMRREWMLSTFIGLTSAIGSIAWFAAFAMANASYVRAVGQVEMVFTLLISALHFRERLLPLELAGIAVVVAGVVVFRLAQ